MISRHDGCQAGWSDVLYLAFLYLDVDCDGQLSADDLSVHLPGVAEIEFAVGAILYRIHRLSMVILQVDP